MRTGGVAMYMRGADRQECVWAMGESGRKTEETGAGGAP